MVGMHVALEELNVTVTEPFAAGWLTCAVVTGGVTPPQANAEPADDSPIVMTNVKMMSARSIPRARLDPTRDVVMTRILRPGENTFPRRCETPDHAKYGALGAS